MACPTARNLNVKRFVEFLTHGTSPHHKFRVDRWPIRNACAPLATQSPRSSENGRAMHNGNGPRLSRSVRPCFVFAILWPCRDGSSTESGSEMQDVIFITARYYRDKAAQTRALAGTMNDEDSRKILMGCAQDYERMASLLDDMAGENGRSALRGGKMNSSRNTKLRRRRPAGAV